MRGSACRLLLLALCVFHHHQSAHGQNSKYQAASVSNPDDACYLLGRKDQMDQSTTVVTKDSLQATKPFPGLDTCYQHNSKACCKSAHDSSMSIGLFSDTCASQSPYSDFSEFECFGCHPDQPKFTVVYDQAGLPSQTVGKYAHKNCTKDKPCVGHIRLCRDFVYKKLMPNCAGLTVPGDAAKTKELCTKTDGLTSPTCCFDATAGECINGPRRLPDNPDDNSCKFSGADHADNRVEKDKANTLYDNCGMLLDSARLPSYWFSDAVAFLEEYQPPFFDEFWVEIAEVGSAEEPCCLNSGAAALARGLLTGVASMVVVAVVAASNGMGLVGVA